MGTTVSTRLRVDGEPVELSVDARVTLLDALRDLLGVTGPKKGCDHGQCGACTVRVEGRTALSCLTLLAAAEGADVETVHALAADPRGARLREAFVAHDAFQCGFCTPGQLMSAFAALDRPDLEDPAAIREFMSGNLCRCGAYPNIVAAIRQARGGHGA
ncbi:(2Fe-2S)-binding protein [Streptomyces radicis]|uniref:(2Fe-2S)-binding protein n=2 Tax=Streptomyces radicis TaxID=1750517 RepID=A0A3A9VTQ4_9ACTN|nr:(2Fe-2S)-binding protein [Streptomyces radicis]RKN04268.1 (2Fe-2S)-binding protein [Streptomyces radicis]RKN14786.1 (2Fe-2S)-binding protein [Streptomyces radicis]